MTDARAYPRLEVFERLAISDGLAINAERWQQAHRYHRQRQNFHYQALYQPGIVYGLGVAPITDQPDGRLLQVQPGVAIDIEGNPIVVEQPEEFRLTSEADPGQSLLVYLAVSYVDPDQLRRSASTRTVRETFRIGEKLHLDPGDVEICRVQLTAGAMTVQPPANVFLPGPNELDFRGRRAPQPYPPLCVQVGQVVSGRPTDAVSGNGWEDLLRSLPALYPPLGAIPTVQTVHAQTLGRETGLDCQLLAIPLPVLLRLANPAIQRLQSFLATGGLLLVVADFAEVKLLDLLEIGRELQLGLTEAERDQELFAQTGAALQTEIEANRVAIGQQVRAVEQALAGLAPRLGVDWSQGGDLERNHPLRGQPFVFSQLPQRLGHPVIVKQWGGLVLLVGDLSQCWGRDATPPIPREGLRSAQEWGVNLLYLAAQRQQWLRSMQPRSTTAPDPLDTLQQRVQPSPSGPR